MTKEEIRSIPQKRRKIVFPENGIFPMDKKTDSKELFDNIENELKEKQNYKPGLTMSKIEELNKQLLEASSRGDFNQIKELLEQGADVNVKNKDGFILLSNLGSRGFNDVFKMLIDKGANINGINDDGTSVFMKVVESNCLKNAEVLLDKGVDIDFKDKQKRTALERIISDKSHLYVTYGTHSKTIQSIIDYLISKGADIKAKDSKGRNILMRVVFAGREQVEALELVRDDGNIKVYKPSGPFIKYEVRDSKLIEYVLEKNLVPLNEEDNLGKNLLSYILDKSPFEDYAELCDFVLDKGINVNPKIGDTSTPLQRTIFMKDVTLINKLIEKGAIVNPNTYYSTLEIIIDLKDSPQKQEILELMINKGLQIPIKSLPEVGLNNFIKYVKRKFQRAFA
jgi:ankyrin repeat protein